ncbi:hypothetical protein NDU88_002463 [Pleurodeles waltl]|uniref:Uncharacterized protein n=1 Tax=Pleurodeles waltl TaxID=8319 RepID=A0AAV7RFN1_PLEWA|nr:hypothetical protein NDU88_002463 [Pleurodeles waltl]
MGKDKSAKQATAQTRIDQFTTGTTGHQSEDPNPNEGGEQRTTSGDLPAILHVIQASQVAVESKIGEVRVDVALVRQDLRNTTARIIEAESRISTTEDEIAALKRSRC